MPPRDARMMRDVTRRHIRAYTFDGALLIMECAARRGETFARLEVMEEYVKKELREAGFVSDTQERTWSWA